MSLRLRRLRQRLAHYRRLGPRRTLRLHPLSVPFVTIGTLLLLTLAGFLVAHVVRQNDHAAVVAQNKIVIVSHDGQQQIVPSKEHTVGQLLSKLHVQLRQGDVVEPAASTVINQDEFRINIYRAVPVEIVDGAQKNFTYSAEKTPRAIAQQAGASLNAEDDVAANPADQVLQTGAIGEQVVIDRAMTVNLNLYGTPLTIHTHAKTVAELIKEKDIHLAASDQVTPVQDTPLADNTQVFIERNGIKIESVTQTIPMPIQSISDPSLAYGTNAVRQQGSPGQEVITYQDNLRNGVVIGRAAIQTVVSQAPVTQIVVVGSSLSGIKGDMALAGIAPGDYQYADYIISNESGWCPTKAQGQYGGCPAYAGHVPSGGGYGLCQSTPGSKMASAGSDWATNPITQLRWCSGYASRYGGWHGAYEHWLADHSW